jgi:hypothetical protein
MNKLIFVVLISCTSLANGEGDVSRLYEVSTEGSTTSVATTGRGRVVISIQTKDGAHVSDEAPLKIDLKAADVKLEKERLTYADNLTKAGAEQKFPAPRFEVGFDAPKKGKATIDAKMTFFICTEKLCVRQSKNLAIPVTVN